MMRKAGGKTFQDGRAKAGAARPRASAAEIAAIDFLPDEDVISLDDNGGVFFCDELDDVSTPFPLLDKAPATGTRFIEPGRPAEALKAPARPLFGDVLLRAWALNARRKVPAVPAPVSARVEPVQPAARAAKPVLRTGLFYSPGANPTEAFLRRIGFPEKAEKIERRAATALSLQP